MIVITVEGNITNIKTNDLVINIKGSYEIKKEGAEAPIISVASE